jgi:uncharacterized protein
MASKNQMSQFIGRKHELSELSALLKLKCASMVVMNGRRRIGKSRLAKEFSQPHTYYSFSGLPPRKDMLAQDQRNEFSRALREQLALPGIHSNDWADLFVTLAKQVQKGRVVILLDEISWMAFGDSDFLGKLKTVWDTHFANNPKLMLILCGSVSSWIEKNILSSTGYLGRPALHIRLQELPLVDCNQFWDSKKITAFEKLKMLAVTGGVPRYLELMNPSLTAEENIRSLCFSQNAALFTEYDRVFADVYDKRSEIYTRIVDYLVSHSPALQEDISQYCGLPQNGELSEYLNDLELGGFIARDYTWSLKTKKISKLSKYRLKDNYTRFYLKYIFPNREQIKKGYFRERSLASLPNWTGIIGLQFENLVLNNHHLIFKQLGLFYDEIVFDNPFFQRKTARAGGCQIDYMIQTCHQTIYVCEIKFCNEKISTSIIEELENKINALQVPKNTSVRPVLIHVNGVSAQVVESGYFANIIDFGDMLLG